MFSYIYKKKVEGVVMIAHIKEMKTNLLRVCFDFEFLC